MYVGNVILQTNYVFKPMLSILAYFVVWWLFIKLTFSKNNLSGKLQEYQKFGSRLFVDPAPNSSILQIYKK